MPDRSTTGRNRGVSSSGTGRTQSATTNTPNVPRSVSETDQTISYEISITKSLGDYEFIKLTAGVTVPVTITDAELSQIDDKMTVIRDKMIKRLDDDFKLVNL